MGDVVSSALATEVQRRYHAGVRYAPRQEAWRAAALGGAGDCNAIALAKRAALLHAGAPGSALHLCRCWTETREAHMVLIVDTDKAGTLVLDNRHAEPMRRQDLPLYRWSFIEDNGQWFAVA